MPVIQGDCREVMARMEENSIDSVVVDPPYALTTTARWKDDMEPSRNQSDVGKRFSKGFMGKEWDGKLPGVEVWQETLRVCKPGAHMLAFGGTRTHHRLMVAIEDAGWEIRDTLMWVYGSGFPKSLDISKQLDKVAGVEREVVGTRTSAFGDTKHSETKDGRNLWCKPSTTEVPPTGDPITDSAKQWSGWGTALKPAWEPIIVCRKPLDGTVAQNILKWGVGGINIDGCRVPGIVDSNPLVRNAQGFKSNGLVQGETRKGVVSDGRFPANIIHDGSEEVLEIFPKNAGAFAKASGPMLGKLGTQGRFGNAKGENMPDPCFYGDRGSAARFFYCAKTSTKERDLGLPEGTKNTHPTVKPLNLCRYLCRLVTPPGGVILDPFAGSGSTGCAAVLEGFTSFLIEMEPEYVEIAKARLKYWSDHKCSL